MLVLILYVEEQANLLWRHVIYKNAVFGQE